MKRFAIIIGLLLLGACAADEIDQDEGEVRATITNRQVFDVLVGASCKASGYCYNGGQLDPEQAEGDATYCRLHSTPIWCGEAPGYCQQGGEYFGTETCKDHHCAASSGFSMDQALACAAVVFNPAQCCRYIRQPDCYYQLLGLPIPKVPLLSGGS